MGTPREVQVKFIGSGTELEKKLFFQKPQIFRNFSEKLHLKKTLTTLNFLGQFL